MIRRASYVVCDRCNSFPCEIAVRGAKEARYHAKQEGYERVGNEDVCPSCQAKAEQVGEGNDGG